MAFEIVQNAAGGVDEYPLTRPASATGKFYSPGGSDKGSLTVSVESVGSGGTSTIASVDSTQTVLVVDDATNIVAGGRYWLTSQNGWGASILVSKVNGTTVTLESGAPGSVQANDTIHGLKVSATVPASMTTDRGMFYRIEWSVTDTDADVRSYQTIVHVVRMQFKDPITSSDAARYVESTFPGYATDVDAGHWRELALRASGRVRRMLRASGNYPNLIGDADSFRDAGLIALRIELAQNDGLVPPGYDPSIYAQDSETSLKRVIAETLANQWVDRGDDGAVDADDIRGIYTVRAFRA